MATSKKSSGLLINHDRADAVLDALAYRHNNGLYPYNKSLDVLPQEAYDLFTYGSKEHAMFLFNLCYYMRGGIQSDEAARKYVKIYKKHKHLFRASYFRSTKEARLKELADEVYLVLQRNELNYTARSTSYGWVWNAHKLFHHWQGNPARLFDNISSYEQACDIIKNKTSGKRSGWKRLEQPKHFYGFQEKMVSMILYFLAQARMVDMDTFPPPIDFHFFRILLSTEILYTKKKVVIDEDYLNIWQRTIGDKARHAMSAYMQRRDMSAIDLGDIVWNYSRDMCSSHPENISEKGEYQGRRTGVSLKPYTWNETNLTTYQNTCGLCKIREYCKYSVPSAPYYIQGKLIIRSERPDPPPHLLQQKLFLMDPQPKKRGHWAKGNAKKNGSDHADKVEVKIPLAEQQELIFSDKIPSN